MDCLDPIKTSWTPEEDCILIEMHKQNCVYSEIAHKLRRTTGSVSGRLFRLGLCKVRFIDKQGRKWGRRNGEGRSRKPSPIRTHGFVYRPPEMRGNEKTTLEPEYSPYRVRLLDLKDHHCRWPISGEDPEQFYCGAKSVNGRSYCPYHAKMAYKPEEPIDLMRLCEVVR